MNDLLYRRQFLLASQPCEKLAGWQHVTIGGHQLYAHPDLALHFAELPDRGAAIVLLGYVVDRSRPTVQTSDVVVEILTLACSVDRLCETLSAFGGRFVVLVSTADDLLVFHDPCGLRCVHYMRCNGFALVGSQPNIFELVAPLNAGEQSRSYFGSHYVKTDIEHWLPSGISIYEDVLQLVPNHYLRLSDLRQTRYWPTQRVGTQSVSDAVDRSSQLLRMLMRSASHQFKLAIAMTGGWDSRMILGASKDISEAVYYYTLRYRDLRESSDDVRIPRTLLRELGLEHAILECCGTDVPSEFAEKYCRNSATPHLDDWGSVGYRMLGSYPGDRVAVKGNCAEIARCFYYKYGTHREIYSPDQLLELEPGWRQIPFICDHIATWYREISPVAKQMNIDILDLFYWEHRMGGWQAQSQLEWDIAQEAFVPFNHRPLLELMLGVPARYRCAPGYTFYRAIIEVLWPEVLSSPINPSSPFDRIKDLLNSLGLYNVTRDFCTHYVRRGQLRM